MTDSKTPQGNILTEPAEIEDSFRTESINKYSHPPLDKIDPVSFQTVTEFNRQNPDLNSPHRLIDITRLQSDSLTVKPVTFQEVVRTILNAKNRAPGPDQIKRIHLVNSPKF